MGIVTIDEAVLQALGPAIRAKTGSTELLHPGDMASAVEGISAGLDTSDGTLSGYTAQGVNRTAQLVAGAVAYSGGQRWVGALQNRDGETFGPSVSVSADGNSLQVDIGDEVAYYVPMGGHCYATIGAPQVRSLFGWPNIKTGTHTLSSDVVASGTITITHDLGDVPDLFMFYRAANLSQTYTELGVIRFADFMWRNNYPGKAFYHGTSSSTSVSCADVSASYGVKSLTASQAVITGHTSGSSYCWRAGAYKWIAIKF